jgi:L-asparaginase / beta-aspartyl-peptidase
MFVKASRGAPTAATAGVPGARWTLLVHGGAGEIGEGEEEGRIEGCRAAARRGAAVLAQGGSAIDAVQQAVIALEDDPRFNAGTGACLNELGLIQLDASIMEGRGLGAGAVCALPPFRNPIAVARAVLEEGRHVLYAADGAADFARRAGFSPLTSADMTTERARARFRDLSAARPAGRPRGDAIAVGSRGGGTVGAVAKDASGLVAAATSTGGTAAKRLGRVGDTPIVGAGTYADDEAGAASATGLGEAILRACLGKRAVDALSAGADPETAARESIEYLCRRTGGGGGIILVDRSGRMGLARSTASMAWGACWDGLAGVEAGS